MDPLITNAIDPALLRVLEKRGEARDPAARRKRAPVPKQPDEEENIAAGDEGPSPGEPKHVLDDLA